MSISSSSFARQFGWGIPVSSVISPFDCKVWSYLYRWSTNLAYDGYWLSTAQASDGSVFVAGLTATGGTIDINYGNVAKFSSTGSLLWQKYIGTVGIYADFYVAACAVDASDNVYVLAWQYVTNTIQVYKFDTNGNNIWQKDYDVASSPSNAASRLFSIFSVSDGLVIGSGWNTSTGTPGNKNFIFKIDFSGNVTWANTAAVNYPFFGRATFTKSSTDDFYVARNFWDSTTAPQKLFYVEKYNSSGTLQLTIDTQLGEALSDSTSAGKIAALSTGEFYVWSVYTPTSTLVATSALSKFDSSGNLLWSRLFSDQSFFVEQGITDGQNVYFLGVSNTNTKLLKIDSTTDTVTFYADISSPYGQTFFTWNGYESNFMDIEGNFITFAGWPSPEKEAIIYKIPKNLENFSAQMPLSISGYTGWEIDLVSASFGASTTISASSITNSVNAQTLTVTTPTWTVWDPTNIWYGGTFSYFDNGCALPPPPPPPPLSFTPVSVPGTGLTLRSIVFQNSSYFMAASQGTIFSSPDAVTWTQQTNIAGITNSLYGIAYGNSTFVTVGDGGRIATSPDGTTWTSRTSGTTSNLSRVGFGNSVFIATKRSGSNQVLRSIDNGVTWTSTPVTGVNRGITYNPDTGTWVVVGNAGNIITSTDDGVTWTTQTSGTINQLWGVNYINSQYYAVGASGTILRSTDAVTWTSVNDSGSTAFFSMIFYANGTYLIVGDAGALLTSPLGTSEWRSITSGATVDLNYSLYNSGNWYVAGSPNPSGTTTLLKSTN